MLLTVNYFCGHQKMVVSAVKRGPELIVGRGCLGDYDAGWLRGLKIGQKSP